MLRLLADENFNGLIFRGVLREAPAIEFTRAQDVGLANTDDSLILEWTATHARILVTHDVNTIPAFASERIRCGQRMTGVFVVPAFMPIGRAIHELLLLDACSLEGEWNDRVLFLPF